MFTNKKREDINTFVCAIFLFVAETSKTSAKDHESPLPIVGIVAYGFVGQPFSKQLYICYLPAGRSVLGKTVPEVLSTARGRRRTQD